ncbi:MAG: hypothetical protein COZ34_02295 [Candidatus Pacebacteria bacterium CG_4_10_14_3_um_filter_34_15]|nr:hypothetical protein [Candidatus Paceibacterota bacterium]OIO44586.1 MAG: hypothetical protein AUJ41_02425 [Candidatus Pacebacteria bacterium CG1_02_43_31]PIQ80698.1 MAG: hypothetical protein COV78_04105 [Candidatus Pacebacteria bacterium CG11_big_fil_rev_8_21_14_0_20_34_55]PIX81627.1 MAG: hypothetical protein COZ34_02295 [Candidatus Pacebacteria bacterium CG_4_10_14_3_um_filter_34_15]PJC43556.1 MAG: hypothetical protein CO039_03445 [Candidatus Pacebacteria bacterium CG_4_9_14_0_2_um_filter_
MKEYVKLNYILGIVVFFFGLSKLLSPLEPLNLMGLVYYVVTAVALFKKPKIGYTLLVVSIMGLVLAYTINYYVNSW